MTQKVNRNLKEKYGNIKMRGKPKRNRKDEDLQVHHQLPPPPPPHLHHHHHLEKEEEKKGRRKRRKN